MADRGYGAASDRTGRGRVQARWRAKATAWSKYSRPSRI